MKKTLTRLVLVLAAVYLHTAYAAPAAPIEIELSQPDGTTFRAVTRGDEYSSWTETLGGHTVIKSGDTWFYAELNSAGQLRAGNRPVGSLDAEQLRQLPRHLSPARDPDEIEQRTIRKLPRNSAAYAEGIDLPQAISLTQYTLTILVDYTDVTFTYSDESFQSLMYGASDSVKEFFLENSYNGFTIAAPAETYGTANDGVIHVSRPVAHPNHGQSFATSRAEAQAIVQLADPYIDYSTYDTNADNVISSDELSIVIILAGYENSFGGVNSLTPRVWGHQSSFSPVTVDGVSLSPYTMFGERHGTANGTHQATIGVMCHELGHLMFDLPDLYDVDGSSAGIGRWGLMAGGSWNQVGGSSGDSPAHLSAWSKVVTGLTLPQDVANNQSGVGIAQASSNEVAKRVWIDEYKVDEYFLVENRQQSGFDAGLPGSGLLIWHIDQGVRGNSDESHKLVDLEEADGLAELDSNPGVSDTGDPFPGITDNTTFDNDSNPNSMDYMGGNTGIAVTSISASGANMTADFTVPPNVVGDHVRYDENITGISAGYNDLTAWLGQRVTNDTAHTQLDGVDVYVTDDVSATIEVRFYSSLTGGTPGTLIHSQAGFAAGPGWNRLLFTTPQSFPIGEERGIVLKIVNDSDLSPIAYDNRGPVSGRSYIDRDGAGTFFPLCSGPGVCHDLNLVTLFSGGNTAPGFTPAAAVGRQQGSVAGAAIAVGTASDAETADGLLVVTQVAGGTATGITVNNISNSNGSITAELAASCSASSGTVRFLVSDGDLSSTGDLQVNVTANTQPTLTYDSKSIDFGADDTHAALTGPSDNGTVNSVSVQGTGTYTGTSSVNPAGLVSLSNAQPVGAHTITIRAADNCSANRDASFQLQVNAIVPGAPTIGSATAGNTQATVSFTPPASNGGAAIDSYTVTSSPGGFTGNGAASPINVTGLTNGQAYTFTVTATNSAGTGPASAASNAVTPAAPQTITFNNPGDQDFGTTPTLTATATSGLPVAFSSTTPAVCAITVGGTLTFNTTGNCSIDANQAGNSAFLPATTVTQSFAVNAVVPGAPTAVSASAGDAEATISFTPPAFTGGAAVSSYTVTSSSGNHTAMGATSPLTVTGLTNDQPYTFTVTATNSAGTGPASAPSNEVTPTAGPVEELIFSDGFEPE